MLLQVKHFGHGDWNSKAVALGTNRTAKKVGEKWQQMLKEEPAYAKYPARKPAKLVKQVYKCKVCGLPKKGHTCGGVWLGKPKVRPSPPPSPSNTAPEPASAGGLRR